MYVQRRARSSDAWLADQGVQNLRYSSNLDSCTGTVWRVSAYVL